MNERLPQVSAQKKLRIHHCLSWQIRANTATRLETNVIAISPVVAEQLAGLELAFASRAEQPVLYFT